MKRRIVFYFLVVFSFLSVFAGQEIALKDLQNPETIAVDRNQIYITEGPCIYIYSRSDFKLIKKFGKDGQGPGEFKTISPFMPLRLNVISDQIIVKSMEKISYYRKDGTFVREFKPPTNYGVTVERFGNLYLGFSGKQDNGKLLNQLVIYDQNFSVKSVLLEAESPFQGLKKGTKLFSGNIQFQIIRDRCFVFSEDDFVIDVFDLNGKKVKRIKIDYQRVKVTSAIKQDTEKFFQENALTRQYYEYMKPLIFPEFLPAIWVLAGDGQFVYPVTFLREKNKQELMIIDAAGKILKKTRVAFDLKSLIEPYPFSVYDQVLYQLVEKDEDDFWRLRIIPLTEEK